MPTAERTDEKLWTRVKNKLLKENDNKWDARLAQRAVRAYKDAGGGYTNKVPRAKTSLAKWTKEDWGYAGKPDSSRYLPTKVRKSLTVAETRKENKLKGSKKGQRIPYTESVKKKMKLRNIY